jgi:hypothetical protein
MEFGTNGIMANGYSFTCTLSNNYPLIVSGTASFSAIQKQLSVAPIFYTRKEESPKNRKSFFL